MLEAMASGLPVVASDLPANSEWIEPGVTGELWAGSDEASLADAIVSAFARSTALGVAARDRVRARAERRAQMDRMAELYRQLAASRGVVP